uniref:Lytic polysaccharide monooxygenase n=1 Tax=Podosphaera xanthii TaxID=135283 RepID=A0A8E4PV92_9PEZI|nr:lytic polysaccharide monooxygenase [Podosphaera xanthii]
MFCRGVSSYLFLASLATAHFNIQYPEVRGDVFAENASQRIFPCANVDQTSETNRTQWPLDGGSVSLKLYHSWTYIFINLGLGSENPKFNVSLTPNLLKETGKGDFCLPKLTLPKDLVPEEGQNASIQVVAVGPRGDAFYSCSDITFSKNATIQSEEVCTNSTGVNAVTISSSSGPNIPSPPHSGSSIRFESSVGAAFAAVLGAIVMGHF